MTKIINVINSKMCKQSKKYTDEIMKNAVRFKKGTLVVKSLALVVGFYMMLIYFFFNMIYY